MFDWKLGEAMHRDALRDYLDELLQAAQFRDYCPNGLQVEGRVEIRRIVCGVSASQALLVTGADGRPTIHVGIDAFAVVACVALVAWRRNLLLGLLVAVVMTAGVRALGVG